MRYVALFLLAATAQSQTARLAHDLRTDLPVRVTSEFMPFGEAAYFVGRVFEDRERRAGLWRYDGAGAAQLVAAMERPRGARGYAATDEALFFLSDWDLWRWDGATLEAVVTREDRRPCGSQIAALGGAVYFCGSLDDGSYKYKLWVWDAEDGARVAADVAPHELTRYGDALYFAAHSDDAGDELWTFDGATARVAADVAPGQASSRPSALTPAGGALYFSAETAEHGRELWRWDGQNARLVADVHPGPASSDPSGVAVLDGAVYFSASDEQAARLWRVADQRAEVAADLWPWHGYDDWRGAAAAGGALYGAPNDGTYGRELWRWDGSEASLVRDLAPGSGSSEPRGLTALGDELLFYDDQRRAYVANGDALRPLPVRAAAEHASAGSDPRGLTSVGERLYFTAQTPLNARELWTLSNGQVERFADVFPDAGARLGAGAGRAPAIAGTDGAWLYFERRGAYRSNVADTVWAFDGRTLRATPDVELRHDMLRVDGAAYAVGQATEEGEAARRPQLATLDGGAVRLVEGTENAFGPVRYSGGVAFGRASDGHAADVWTYDGSDLTRLDALSDTLAAYDANQLSLHPAASLYMASAGRLWRFDGSRVLRVDLDGRRLLGVAAVFDDDELLVLVGSWGGRPDLIESGWSAVVRGDTLADNFNGGRRVPTGESVVYNGVRYVSAGVYGPLYRHADGQANGPLEVVPSEPFALEDPGSFAVHEGALYFAAGGRAGRELWVLETAPTATPHWPGSSAGALRVAPNPASASVTVRLVLEAREHVHLAAYDLLGRRLAVLHDGPLAASEEHTFRIDAGSWPAGVYTIHAAGATVGMTRTLVVTH